MARENLGAAPSVNNDLVRKTDLDTGLATKQATGNYITALTSDVTASGPGSAPATIAANVVSFAKIQQIATDRLLGRDTAATGNVEELTVSGGVEFTGSGGIRTSAFTGDVTKSAGGTAQTIANDAVTYAKMQNVANNNRFLGRISGAAGDVEELTAANAKTILAYAASDVAFTPTGDIAATNVQAAIAEMLSEAFPLGWGAWTAYTPTWSTSGTQPAIGNGTLAGAYTQIGKTVLFRISLTAGSTTTFGTNPWLFSMPVTALGGTYGVGSARLVDLSTGNQYGRYVSQQSTAAVFMLGEAASSFVTATVPFTWANTDILTLTGNYQAA